VRPSLRSFTSGKATGEVQRCIYIMEKGRSGNAGIADSS
jgi:hypothetical protein